MTNDTPIPLTNATDSELPELPEAPDDNPLRSYAEHELRLVRNGDSDEPDMLHEDVLELIDVFSKQGHSGSSAPVAVRLFARLAMFNPLTPLTGEDDEWNKVGPNTWQNRRRSSVFKDADGRAYDIDGITFWEWWTNPETGEKHKVYYSSAESHVDITFPYTPPDQPKVEYKPSGVEG